MTMTEPKASKAASKSDTFDFDLLLDEVRADGPKPITFMKGGVEFTVPSPMDWSDELLEMQAAGQQNPESINVVAMAKGILGAEQYARFVEAGGTAMRFQLVLPKLMGGKPGESSGS